MTLIELFFFVAVLLVSIFLGRLFFPKIGLWSFLPAIIAGAFFAFALLAALTGTYRELWQLIRGKKRQKEEKNSEDLS